MLFDYIIPTVVSSSLLSFQIFAMSSHLDNCGEGVYSKITRGESVRQRQQIIDEEVKGKCDGEKKKELLIRQMPRSHQNVMQWRDEWALRLLRLVI